MDLQTVFVSRLFISDVDGNVIVRSTTNSTSNTTGALIFAGGVGIAGNIAAANVVITGVSRLGTVTSGTWNGESISTTYTDAKVTSVNGQTGAATGFATTANTLAQFAATTSAQLATLISDETGTGSLVFATTPTLVTPVLGLATGTSVMLSANIGAAAGNVSGNFTVGSLQTTGQITASAGTITSGAGRVGFGTDAGGSITLGNISSQGASTPYIDFNSGATSIDYDARIQGSGGTGVNGKGNLSFTADISTFSGNVNTSNLRVASFSTLGTVVSGTWNGSSISTTYTDAKVTSVNGSTGAVTGLATNANPVFTGTLSVSGTANIMAAVSNTTSHIIVTPPSGSSNANSKISLFGTFWNNADTGPRLISTLKSGFSTGVWGTEYLDVLINNGSPAGNDARTEANQNRVIRITNGNVDVTGNITASNIRLLSNGVLTFADGTTQSTAVSGAITSVNGRTGVVTGLAETANSLSQFASTTSAQLSTLISDETGSGALVFATTPTLVTPILGLATGTSVMLSANIGAAAGNVSGNFTVGSLQTTGNVTADRVLTVNNGNSENLRIGDDIWLGDYNIANSLKLKGINNPAAAFISFGNSDGATLGRTGLGALTYTAGFAAANIVVTNNVNSGSGLITGSLSVGNISLLSNGILTFADGTTQSTAVSGAITSVNGRTGIVTGLAETANSLSQFASTTSAQLATLISDETGTGSLVFARSPTLLTAMATAIGSNTTPAFRVYDTFNRTINFLPNVSAGSYNSIVTTNDSLIYFTGTGINTGNLVIAPHAAYNFGLKLDAVGNTIYMYGDTRASGNATFTGKVGVGLTSPGAILETEEDTTGATEHRITNSNTGSNTTKNARLTFRLTDTVGTRKDVAYISAIPFNADSSAGAHLTFSTRTADATPTEKVRINNDGNVLVGTFTTSIAKKFTVVGEANFTDVSNNTRLYTGYGTIPTTGGTGAYVFNNDNTPLVFGTSNTERLRVTALGGVAFGGAANYGTSGQLLQSNGDAVPTWVSANTLTANIANFINVTDDTTTNATRYPIFANATSGNVIEQVSSTKLTFNPSTGLLTSTDYNSSSDRRLKKNIKTVENALDKVIALRGVSFDWKEGGARAYGLIAQEAEKVIPEIVDHDDNGYLGIKYNNLIGVLVEAIKDQQDQINILKKLMEKP